LLASKTSRLGQPKRTHSDIASADQRTDREIRTGAGKRPQLNSFQHCLGDIFSAAATPLTVNNSVLM